jgi:type VI secretion system protein ImpF
VTPADEHPRLLPSFIDRLLDPESMGGRLAGYDHRQMMDAVRGDVEDLLNARLTATDLPPAFEQTARSILTYGLPDLSGFDVSGSAARTNLTRVVATTIERFEPRLRRVRVTILDDKTKGGLSVRFRVEAELNVDPAPEVGFETVLELTTGRAAVSAPGVVG